MSCRVLETPICELFGCRYPILQAGMGGVARARLAAAVSNAGALGCLGMVRESPEFIREQVHKVRSLTERPFGVNLIPSATDPVQFHAELDECIRLRVPVMSFFWNVATDAIKKAKDAGCIVIYQVGNAEDAVLAEEAGADVIVAQGFEAGGHVHGTVGSLVLIQDVCDAVSVPVVASGGFSSGRSLVAAIALGAQGIQVGTAFVATEESFAHLMHKQRIVDSQASDTLYTDAFAINWPPGSPVRVLRSEETVELESQPLGHLPDEAARQQVAEEGGRPIYLMSTDSPLQSMTGDLHRLAMYAGQVTGQIKQVASAASVVQRMVDEARQVLSNLRIQ